MWARLGFVQPAGYAGTGNSMQVDPSVETMFSSLYFSNVTTLSCANNVWSTERYANSIFFQMLPDARMNGFHCFSTMDTDQSFPVGKFANVSAVNCFNTKIRTGSVFRIL